MSLHRGGMKSGSAGLSWLRGLAALLVLGIALSACKREEAPRQADSGDLVQQLSGVWTTAENAGTDDAETVYLLDPRADGSLRIVRDGEWVANVVEDVDPDARTVLVRRNDDTSPKELLTFKAVHAEADPSKAFHLRLTYGNGQVHELGYVRRLSTADMASIEEAARRAKGEAQVGAVPAVAEVAECAQVHSTRMRLVCGSDELRRLHLDYRENFALLGQRFPEDDVQSTLAAAEKQLENCRDAACVRKAYQDWETYLGDNYHLFDAY